MPYNTRKTPRNRSPPTSAGASIEQERGRSTHGDQRGGHAAPARSTAKAPARATAKAPARATAKAPARPSSKKTARVRTPDELEEAAEAARLRTRLAALEQELDEARQQQEASQQAARAREAASPRESSRRSRGERTG